MEPAQNALLIFTVISLGCAAKSLGAPVIPTELKLQNVCSQSDLRQPSLVSPIARMAFSPGISFPGDNGCTGALISKNCMISAGHCESNLRYAQFNVPPSTPNAQMVPPDPNDVYDVDSIIDIAGSDSRPSRPGEDKDWDDWAVFKLKPNNLTKKSAGSVQSSYNIYAENGPPLAFQRVQVTGYGRAAGSLSCVQHTMEGTLILDDSNPIIYYDILSTGGDSGAPVILKDTQQIIGIETMGPCNDPATKGLSSGTAIWAMPKLKAAIQKCVSSD